MYRGLDMRGSTVCGVGGRGGHLQWRHCWPRAVWCSPRCRPCWSLCRPLSLPYLPPSPWWPRESNPPDTCSYAGTRSSANPSPPFLDSRPPVGKSKSVFVYIPLSVKQPNIIINSMGTNCQRSECLLRGRNIFLKQPVTMHLQNFNLQQWQFDSLTLVLILVNKQILLFVLNLTRLFISSCYVRKWCCLISILFDTLKTLHFIIGLNNIHRYYIVQQFKPCSASITLLIKKWEGICFKLNTGGLKI